jgi:hypothetical protein
MAATPFFSSRAVSMTGMPRTPIGREDRRRWIGSDSVRMTIRLCDDLARAPTSAIGRRLSPQGLPVMRQPRSFAPETTTVLIRRREDPARVRAGDCSPVNRAVPSVRCGPPHSGRAAASNASGEAFSTAPALRNVVTPCGTLTGNSRRICPLSLSGILTRSMGSRRWPRDKTYRRLVHSSPSPSRDGRHLE